MIDELVRQLYAALAAGDGDTVASLLAADFDGSLADGMPLGLGGPKAGMRAMRDDGWWALGREFAVRAVPEEWIDCSDGRLLVIGRYAGRARSTGIPLDAAFAHLWEARDGRLTSLRHFTDTALWRECLQAPA